MRFPWFVAAFAAPLGLMLTAGSLFAGVVVGETLSTQAPNGEMFSEDKTIYLQGNKEKIQEKSVATITDLDKNVIYIVDQADRAYAEMPLQALTPAQPGNAQHETVDLKKTGEARVIANHPCNEYRGVEANKVERVIISACVSTSAPGAREVSQFDRKILARLGAKPEQTANHDVASLMLEKQSVLSLRVRDWSRSKGYRTISLVAQSRVNKIQLKPLPLETFTPPKGYSKIQNGRSRKVAPNLANPAINL
jgi:hypothetical protein